MTLECFFPKMKSSKILVKRGLTRALRHPIVRLGTPSRTSSDVLASFVAWSGKARWVIRRTYVKIHAPRAIDHILREHSMSICLDSGLFLIRLSDILNSLPSNIRSLTTITLSALPIPSHSAHEYIQTNALAKICALPPPTTLPNML